MAALRPVMLVILDGWGTAPPGPYNAITVAHTPHFDALCGTAARTPSCAPPASMSACPLGRWAIPRSAISTSAPAAW